jgi:toxin CptA
MSRHSHRAPLRLHPRPSRRLAVFLVLVHAATAAAVLGLPVHWAVRGALVLLTGAGLAYGLAVHVLRLAPWAVTGAVWEPDGTWTLTLASGREVEARLLPSTFVTTVLIVLNLRCGRWYTCSLVLPGDALDPDLLRRLRARLRATAPEAAGSEGPGSFR